MMIKAASVAVLLSQLVFAQSPETWIARIIGGTAPIKFNGQAIEVGAFVTENGVLKTGRGGGAKVFFRSNFSVLNLDQNSELKINEPSANHFIPKKQEGALLERGSARWLSEGKSKPLAVRTKNTTIRGGGSEFYAEYEPSTRKTKVMVIGGEVEFENVQANGGRGSSVTVRSGQESESVGANAPSKPKAMLSGFIESLKSKMDFKTLFDPNETQSAGSSSGGSGTGESSAGSAK